MFATIYPISPLLLGLAILLVGNGMLAILLGLKSVASFGEAVTGFVMGGYFVGYVAGYFIIPRLLQAVGHIRTFAATAAMAAVATVAHGAFVDPFLWLLLRLISGVCLVGIYMVVESWLNAQTPNTHRGQVFSIYMVITLTALGIGLFAAPLAGDSGRLEPYVLASVLFSLGLVPVAVTPMPQPHAVAPPPTGFRRLIRASATGFAGALIAGVVNGILWALGPAFWRGLGLSEGESALFMALVIAGGVLLQWPIGRFSDHRDRRKVLAGVCLLAALVALSTLVAVDLSLWLLGCCALAYGGLMFTIYGLCVAHVNDRVAPEEILESTRALLLLYGIGAALGPMTLGPVMQVYGAPALALCCAAMLLLLAAVSMEQIWVRKAVEPEEQAVFVALTRTSQAVLDMLPDAAAPPETEDRVP